MFAHKPRLLDSTRRPAEPQRTRSLRLGYKLCAAIPVAGQRTHGTTFWAFKVTSQVATPGAESAVCDCLVCILRTHMIVDLLFSLSATQSRSRSSASAMLWSTSASPTPKNPISWPPALYLITRLAQYLHAHRLPCNVMAMWSFMGLLQLRYEHDSSTIRLRFERDTTSYEELCAFEQ